MFVLFRLKAASPQVFHIWKFSTIFGFAVIFVVYFYLRMFSRVLPRSASISLRHVMRRSYASHGLSSKELIDLETKYAARK